MTSAKVEAALAELNTTDNIKTLYRRYGVHYPWFAVAAITLGNVAALITGTIINVAIPQIMGAFGINQEEAQWLSTAYLAASTVAMLLTWWLVQAVGMRLTIVIALSLFMAGSLIGGLSPNPDVLIIARILQGMTAGIIGPLAMSTIFQLFPPGKQGLAMGITSIGMIMGPALGPAVGGLLVDSFSWRYVFLMGIPFSLVCLPLSLLFLPDRDQQGSRPPFDWTGMALLSIALTSLLVGLSNGEREGWNSNIIVGLFGLTVLFGGLFIYWQRSCDRPLLNLQVFLNRNFLVMSVVGFVFGAGLYGSTYLVPLFLQLIQGMSPTDAGVMMIPAGLVLGVIFPVAGRLADRMDLRILISLGIVFFAASFYLMNDADADTGFWLFSWWLIIGRIGIGLVMPALNMGALRDLPPQILSEGAGVLSFTRQLGGAFGVNLTSVLLARRSNFHTDELMATQTYDNIDMGEWLKILQELLAQNGLVVVEQTVASMNYLGVVIHQQAMILGFRDAFLIVALCFLATMIPTWFLRVVPREKVVVPAKKAETQELLI